MVEFSRTHLQEGHLAIMWKDTAFNYAYYLWFEDMTVRCISIFNNSDCPIKLKIIYFILMGMTRANLKN